MQTLDSKVSVVKATLSEILDGRLVRVENPEVVKQLMTKNMMKCYVLFYIVFSQYNNNLSSNTSLSMDYGLYSKILKYIKIVFEEKYDMNTRVKYLMNNDKLAQQFSYQRIHCSAIGRALENLSKVANEYNIKQEYVDCLEIFTVLFINVEYDGFQEDDVAAIEDYNNKAGAIIAQLQPFNRHQNGGMLMDHKTAQGWGWFIIHSLSITLISSVSGGFLTGAYVGMVLSKRTLKYISLKREYLKAFAELSHIFNYVMPFLIKGAASEKSHIFNAQFTYQFLLYIDDFVYSSDDKSKHVDSIVDIMINNKEPTELKSLEVKTKKFDCTSFTSSMRSVGRWIKRTFQSYGVVKIEKILHSHILVLDKLISSFIKSNNIDEKIKISYWGSVEVYILNNLLKDNSSLCELEMLMYKTDDNTYLPYSNVIMSGVANVNIIFNYIHNFAKSSHQDQAFRLSDLDLTDTVYSSVSLKDPTKQKFGLIVDLQIYKILYLRTQGQPSTGSFASHATSLLLSSSTAATVSAAASGNLMMGQHHNLTSMLLVDIGSSEGFLKFLESVGDIVTEAATVMAEVAIEVALAAEGGSLKYKKTTEKAYVLGRHRCVYKQGRKKYVKHKGQFTSLTQLLRHQNKYS
jgi:hypothetical protein